MSDVVISAGSVPKAFTVCALGPIRAIEPKTAAGCLSSEDWQCGAVASGHAKYEGEDEYAEFTFIAFADQKTAQAACDKEACTARKRGSG